MMYLLAGDIASYLSNNPFCCVIVFAPGLLVPIYRWLKSRLKK